MNVERYKRISSNIDKYVKQANDVFNECIERGEECSWGEYNEWHIQTQVMYILSEMFKKNSDWFIEGDLTFGEFKEEFCSIYEKPAGSSLDYSSYMAGIAYDWYVLVQ
jgi:hypothetical protein